MTSSGGGQRSGYWASLEGARPRGGGNVRSCLLEVSTTLLAAPALRREAGALTRLLRQPGKDGLNGRERRAFPRGRETIAHARWRLWNRSSPSGEKPRLTPTSTQAQKYISAPSASILRRRIELRCQPPQRLRAPSTRWLLWSRAAFLGFPRDRLFFSSTLPTRGGRCREPGPRPFFVSLPLTHLVFIRPPFSVPGAGRIRSTDGKSRSRLRE